MILFRPRLFFLISDNNLQEIERLKPWQIMKTDIMPTNIYKRWIYGFGPLHYAAFFGNCELLRSIISKHRESLKYVISASFCFANYKFYPMADLLAICCTSYSIQLVSEVIDCYLEEAIFPTKDFFHYTCLHASASLDTAGARTVSSNKFIIFNLLTAGRKDGKTPLHLAAVYRNVRFIEQLILLSKNRQIRDRIVRAAEIKDGDAMTPLEYAYMQKNDKFYEYYLKLAKIVRYEQTSSITNWNSDDMSLLAKTESSHLLSYQLSECEDTSEFPFVGIL